MKTSTVILLAVGGIAGIYIVSKFLATSSSTSAAAAARARQQASASSAASTIGSALGGLINGIFSSHGAGTSNSSDGGAYSSSAAQAAIKGLQSADTVSVTDNFIYTDANGDFIAG